MAKIDWSDEFSKAAVQFAFVAVLGGIAGAWWNMAQKKREMDLAALDRFHHVYGQWFAIWKEWAAGIKGAGKDPKKVAPEARSILLSRATEAEGEFEALLVKIATGRRLSARQRRRLGRFREGYQRLRESIEDMKQLEWNVQGDRQARGQYVAFKTLAAEFATLLTPCANNHLMPGQVIPDTNGGRPPISRRR